MCPSRGLQQPDQVGAKPLPEGETWGFLNAPGSFAVLLWRNNTRTEGRHGLKKYNGLPSRLHTIPIAALLTTNNIIDYPCIHGANIKNCSSSRTNILTYKQYNMKIEGGMTSKTHPYLLPDVPFTYTSKLTLIHTQMWPFRTLLQIWFNIPPRKRGRE